MGSPKGLRRVFIIEEPSRLSFGYCKWVWKCCKNYKTVVTTFVNISAGITIITYCYCGLGCCIWIINHKEDLVVHLPILLNIQPQLFNSRTVSLLANVIPSLCPNNPFILLISLIAMSWLGPVTIHI